MKEFPPVEGEPSSVKDDLMDDAASDEKSMKDKALLLLAQSEVSFLTATKLSGNGFPGCRRGPLPRTR